MMENQIGKISEDEAEQMIKEGKITSDDLSTSYRLKLEIKEIETVQTNLTFLITSASKPARITLLFRQLGYILSKIGVAELWFSKEDIKKYGSSRKTAIYETIQLESRCLVYFTVECFFIPIFRETQINNKKMGMMKMMEEQTEKINYKTAFDGKLFYYKEHIEANFLVSLEELGRPDHVHKCRGGRILELYLKSRVNELERQKRQEYPLRVTHYSYSDLKRMGLTALEIKTFFSTPDMVIDNPYYKNRSSRWNEKTKHMNLFLKTKVHEILQSEEMAKLREWEANNG